MQIFRNGPMFPSLSVCICYEDSSGGRYCLLIRNKSNRKGNELKCGPAEFLAFKSLPVVCHLVTSLLYWSVQNAKWDKADVLALEFLADYLWSSQSASQIWPSPNTLLYLLTFRGAVSLRTWGLGETVGPHLSFVDIILNICIQISSLYSLWHWCSKY